MKKILFIIVAIIIVFVGIGIILAHIAINNFIIPQKIEPLLSNAIQGWTGEKPAIEKIYSSFLRGITIENFTIYTPFAKLPLKFSQLNLKIAYLPLFLRKEFVYNITTSPMEKIGVSFETSGNYSLRDKKLTSKLYIYDLPLSIAKYLFPHLPVEIMEGNAETEISLEMSPAGDLSIEANIPVEKVNLKAFNHSITGSFAVSLNTKKSKSKWEIVKATFNPGNMIISSPQLKDNIVISQGETIFKEETFNLNNLRISFNNRPYKLSGKITNLSTKPRLEFRLEDNKLSLEGNGEYINKEINIEKVLLTLPHSKLNLKGKVQNLKTGQVELYLEGIMDTADLEAFPLRQNIQPKKLNLTSLLEIDAHVSGELKRLNLLNSLIKVKAKNLTMDKFIFEDFSLRVRTERGILNTELKSNGYGGSFVIDIKDLSLKENLPFVANLIIDEVDLKKLNEISLKLGKDLAGIMHGEFTCRGEAKKLKELNGEGWFEIIDGLLWELPVFSKLSKIIEIPGIEKNVFREAHANFVVKNQAITTKDLELISKRLTLKTEGSIYLNGNLDLKLRMELPQEEKETSGVLDKFQDILLKGAGSLIKEVYIKGTIKNPEYKILPAIGNIFQNILQ
ncbi:MAG: AsmA family protein [Candidatus Omnitrophica bacterium]|nr:AsmA family protein [Candidatus Omnitrophota bacterium]